MILLKWKEPGAVAGLFGETEVAGRPKPPRKRGLFCSDDVRLFIVDVGSSLVVIREEFRQGPDFTVGVLLRGSDLDETERLGQPTRALQQPFGLPGHVTLL